MVVDDSLVSLTRAVGLSFRVRATGQGHAASFDMHFAGLLKYDSNGAQVDATALLLLQRVSGTFPLAGILMQLYCSAGHQAA